MKIRITRNTVCDGQVVRAGQVISATVQDARLLIAMQKAVPYEEKAPSLEDRSVGLTSNSQPQLIKRKPGRKPKLNPDA